MTGRTCYRVTGAILVPLLAALGAAGSLSLYRVKAIVNPLQASANAWFELLALALVGLFCLLLLFWWLVATLAGFILAWQARCRGQSTVQLPVWIPGLLKATVAGLLGVGVLSSPALALAPSPPTVASSVSTTLIEPAAGQAAPQGISAPGTDRAIEQPSPLFTAKEEIEAEPLKNSVTLQAAGRYQPITPLFAPAQTEVLPPEEGPARSRPGDRPAASSYTVQPGDSLWSIAEKHLPAQASGGQVLQLVYRIQQANSQTLPTLETLIFPQQQLTIPAPTTLE